MAGRPKLPIDPGQLNSGAQRRPPERQANKYLHVKNVIDRHRGPVTVDLTALAFCDARGLGALVRMAGYAEQKGSPFRLASPSPSLIKVMRITGLGRRFRASGTS